MQSMILRAFLIFGFGLSRLCLDPASAQAATATLDRTVLPIPEPKRAVYTELDARNAKAPPPFAVEAPAGAPNVLIILIDDVGFGASGTFGGPVPMPTLERLAQSGLRYNNFHTTALCSPTRNALKTGRNHHTAETGSIMETATAFPGNTGKIPNSVAPLAEMLRLNGYSTGAFGKWHETAPWEASRLGALRPLANPTRDSTSSTVSSAARRTTGRPTFITAWRRSSCRMTRSITS